MRGNTNLSHPLAINKPKLKLMIIKFIKIL